MVWLINPFYLHYTLNIIKIFPHDQKKTQLKKETSAIKQRPPSLLHLLKG